MKIILSFSLILFSLLNVAQTKRDFLLKDSIIKPINSKQLLDKNTYKKTYSLLRNIDNEFGYEKDIHFKILEYSYFHNELHDFKSNLTILVKEHGLKVDYLTTNENYYNDLMNGKLSNWFKKMYLKSIEEKMKNYELALLFDEVKKSNLSQEVIDMIEKVFKIADDNKIKL